jgi:hypothetical protein
MSPIPKDSHAQTRRKGGQGSEWAAPNCLAGGEKGAIPKVSHVPIGERKISGLRMGVKSWSAPLPDDFTLFSLLTYCEIYSIVYFTIVIYLQYCSTTTALLSSYSGTMKKKTG